MGEAHEPKETKKVPESDYISTVPRVKFGMSGSILASKNEQGGSNYVSILDAEVGAPTQYLQLIDLLYHAKAEDNITIKIFSYGGQVSTGLHIIQGIRSTKAKVTTVGMSLVASIAAVIWLSGHKRKMMPGSTLMCHMPSSGNELGKTLDIAEECTQLNVYFSQLLREVGRGVLTEDELDRIIDKREDTFISSREINSRIDEEE